MALTTTTASFTQPAAGNTVTVTVALLSALSVGAIVTIPNVGNYVVQAVTNPSTVTLQVTGDAFNAISGTVVASGSTINPVGTGGQINAAEAEMVTNQGSSIANLVAIAVTLVSVLAVLGAINTYVSHIPSQGAAPMDGALPVTVASNDTIQTAIKNSVAAIPAQGAAVTSASLPVNVASDQIVPVGAKYTAAGTFSPALVFTGYQPSTSGTLLKDAGGVIHAVDMENLTGSSKYLFLWDQSACNTDAGAKVILTVLNNTVRTVGTEFFTAPGMQFTSGICIAFSSSITSFTGANTQLNLNVTGE